MVKTVEATVILIESCTNFVIITIEHNFFEYELILKKSHYKFIDLYNMLHIYKTYLFEYKTQFIEDRKIITNIKNPSINTIIELVEGILDIKNEYPKIKTHPHEIKLYGKQKKNIRLLITPEQKNRMKSGKVYSITFQKAFGANLFEVLEFELSDTSNLFKVLEFRSSTDYLNDMACYESL